MGNSHRPELIPALEVRFRVFVSILPTRCHLFRPRLAAGGGLGRSERKDVAGAKESVCPSEAGRTGRSNLVRPRSRNLPGSPSRHCYLYRSRRPGRLGPKWDRGGRTTPAPASGAPQTADAEIATGPEKLTWAGIKVRLIELKSWRVSPEIRTGRN